MKDLSQFIATMFVHHFAFIRNAYKNSFFLSRKTRPNAKNLQVQNALTCRWMGTFFTGVLILRVHNQSITEYNYSSIRKSLIFVRIKQILVLRARAISLSFIFSLRIEGCKLGSNEWNNVTRTMYTID